MRYSHQLALGLAAISIAVGLSAACVGDSPTTNPDATASDGGGGNDVTPGEASVGCAARTADDTAGLFIAQTGTDVSSCGTRSNPCQTLTYSIAAAKSASGKTTLYVAAGTYAESIIVDAPLNIEGGWNDNGGTWTPICDGTTSTATTIQGVTNTTVTASFTGTATFRDLEIASKAAADPGESLYGIFALGSTTNLTLDQVVVDIVAGGAGTPGTDGTAGANATDAGCPAGTGAKGTSGTQGSGGGAGIFTSSGYVGHDGTGAGNGQTGQNGTAGAVSCMTCQIFAGSCPNSCGFGQQQQCANGLAGCAGAGGMGGSLGSAGGASIAVYVWDAHVTVFGGTFTTSNGGDGASGGAAGDGGTGTSGAKAADQSCATQLSNPSCGGNFCTGFLVSSTTLPGGNAGGSGGVGGPGGHGGGGSGGVTYDFVQGGDGGVTLNGTPAVAFGDGGQGGDLGGAPGAGGDKWP